MVLRIEDAVLKDCCKFKDDRSVKLKLLQLSLIDSSIVIDDKCRLGSDINLVTAMNAYCDLMEDEFKEKVPETVVYQVDFPKKDESVLDKERFKTTIYFRDTKSEESANYLVSYELKLRMA